MRTRELDYLAEDGDEWQAVASEVMKFLVPQNVGNLLARWIPTLLHAVSQ
jgi:hypothetical protein